MYKLAIVMPLNFVGLVLSPYAIVVESVPVFLVGVSSHNRFVRSWTIVEVGYCPRSACYFLRCL